MAKFPNKVQMPSAITHWSKQDLSCTHVTTSNFMEFNVAKIIEYTPGQKLKISHDVFQRLEPMTVPTFGDAFVHKKAYFVPMYSIFPAWNDFITKSIHNYADGYAQSVSKVPTVLNSTLRNVFIQSGAVQPFSTVVTADKCDFVVTNSNGTFEKRNFTPIGKRFYKLLRSLGYSVDFSLINTDVEKTALPLLAVAKIYFDWYFPNAYATNDAINNVVKFFNYDVSSNTGEFADEFGVLEVRTIAEMVSRVNYDSDYFVSAWDNPMNSNIGAQSDSITISDVTVPSSTTYRSQATSGVFNNGTPVINNPRENGAYVYNLSQYVLTGLKRLTDYLQRHKIAGARSLDRYLSRFGVQLDSEVLKRSKYLNGDTQPVMFADVTSTSDTDGAPLGGFAGRGISIGKSSTFEFESKDAGYIIIVSSIVPKINYYQGQDRMIKHITPLDFYTPEFDACAVQAIGVDEIFVPMDTRKMYLDNGTPVGFNYNDRVFGFNSMYAEYKRGIDQITGDYICGSLNTGKDAWTFGRDVTPFFDNGATGAHNYDFVTGQDAHQYNRIFNITDEGVDQFNIVHRFYIESIFPGRSLFDTYEFDDEDKAKKVSVDAGGVKAN